MRLTQLKLAGFKSFVDPTTLHIHGQRVGVVGPNGCGKSNVMESVRWVLGESSAKEMRGDSMDAVIFNGSGNRKPIARASVELIFDNSLGSVSGAWAQYAEISVKRVIERDKGSTYYINNTTVRRRDVADLFLGTGLGRNSYAIIGQNTISRIVEAKPEELRVFLEEAAGISKYKERRRETELRLRDTRDNLQRVDDIRQEIDKQITRLQAQAAVTQQYHALQQSLKMAQASLWFIHQRDAGVQWEKAQRQVDKLVNDLEAQTAILRKTETELEQLRQQHFEQSQAVQQAQASFYESNATLANLESQIKHHQEAKQRLLSQQEQTVQQMQRLADSLQQLQQQQLQQQQQSSSLQAQYAEAEQALQQRRAGLPQLSEALNAKQQAFQQANQQLLDAQSNLKIEHVRLANTHAQSDQLSHRQQQLKLELDNLSLPDTAQIQQLQQQQQQLQQQSADLQAQISQAQQQESALQQQMQQETAQLNGLTQGLMQQQAQIQSLQNLLHKLSHEEQMDAWLQQTALKDQPRIWQALDIQPGWEVAVQAVLAHQLNAVTAQTIEPQALEKRPPARFTYLQYDVTGEATQPQAGYQPLLNYVQVNQPQLKALLAEMLADVFVVEQDWQLPTMQQALQRHQKLVNRQGDIVSRYGLTFNAAAGANQGLLERQAELKALQEKQPQQQSAVDAQQQVLAQLQQQKTHLQQQQQQLTQQQQQLTQQQHQLDMQLQRLQQSQQHALQRQQAIQAELTQIAQSLQQLEQDTEAMQDHITQMQQNLPQLQALLADSQQQFEQAQQAFQALNQVLQQEEKQLQEQLFNIKINSNTINDLGNRIKQSEEENQRLHRQQDEITATLNAAKMDGLQQSLQQAVLDKQEKEQQLTEVREAMSQLEQTLQERERFRIQVEQLIHPMRDKLEQARLQEQEMRLHFERCQAQLAALDIDLDSLAEQIASNAKASEWQQRSEALQQQIDALGPVNLAAIQELASEQERKQYLDSQAHDLEQAIATLQDAIIKIDKETRARLQNTYDETNRHFADLFKDLFGGGQAKLELLGEEILDSGVQVFAQPPGKKNSTIHLLSGGEKALTALALVFALFKLNPAPFCLMDEVDAPLDDSNTVRFCEMVKKMSERTQFVFVSHNKITMEMAQQLVGVTMQESGVSRVVEVDMEAAVKMQEAATFA